MNTDSAQTYLTYLLKRLDSRALNTQTRTQTKAGMHHEQDEG